MASPWQLSTFIITLMMLALAAFAFVVQWRSGGGVFTDLRSEPRFPGMDPPVIGSKISKSGYDGQPKISITTTTSGDVRQILPWLYYHRAIGVTSFILFVEGKAGSPEAVSILENVSGVRVVPRTEELEKQQSKSRIWNETWLSPYFYRPCNHELFVKQSLNMEMAIVIAREAGVDWIIHVDTDELLYPSGSEEYSLKKLLGRVASDVDMVVFSNYESAVERDDIVDPFTQVTMFKKNYDHLPKDTYYAMHSQASRGNPNYFITYSNGKSAARIQDGLRPNGAHRWHNYKKEPKEVKLDEPVVLHYTYAKFSDLESRRNRCRCKPTKEDVKKCFMLDFDRDAFIISSTGSQKEMLNWYRQHVVWDDKELVLKLTQRGILTRIYAPQLIIEGLKQSGVFEKALQPGRQEQEQVAKDLPRKILS